MTLERDVLRALDPYEAQTFHEVWQGVVEIRQDHEEGRSALPESIVRSALQRLRRRSEAICERAAGNVWLWWKVIPEVIRVDGNVLCEHCGEPYWRHRLSDLLLDYNHEPFLHAGCDGNLLKT